MTTHVIPAFAYAYNSKFSALGHGTLRVTMPDNASLNYSYGPWVQGGTQIDPEALSFYAAATATAVPLGMKFQVQAGSDLPFDSHVYDLGRTSMVVADMSWGDGAFSNTFAWVTDSSKTALDAKLTTMFVLDGDPLPEFGSFEEAEAFLFSSSVSLFATDADAAAGPGRDIDFDSFSAFSVEDDEIHDTTAIGRTISSGPGRDFIAGLSGADAIDGGEDHDIVSYAFDRHKGGELGIVVNMEEGFVRDGFGDVDTLSQIEEIDGTDFGDWVTAGQSALVFNGRDGDDQFLAGSGATSFFAGAGRDRLSYASDRSGVFVDMSRGLAKGSETGRDRFDQVEELIGSTGDDFVLAKSGADLFLSGLDGNDVLKFKEFAQGEIHGDAGKDKLVGSMGSDRLFGGADDDRLEGHGGRDQLFGDDGSDYLYGGWGMDSLFGGAGDDVLRGNQDADELYGNDGADDLRGGSGNDTLFGGAGKDFLMGEDGEDRLFGGAGDDTMIGGSAPNVLDDTRDTFVFADSASGGGGFDRIRDYQDGTDLIDLTAFGFLDFDSDVAVLAEDTAMGLRLDFGNGDVLFLYGFSKFQFDASDVLL